VPPSGRPKKSHAHSARTRRRPSGRVKGTTDKVTTSVGSVRQLFTGPVVKNASALYGSTIVTSLLGFFYWFLAARMTSPRAVGIASAIQSSAQFLSIFCVLGLTTLLISEFSVDKSKARSLILTAATGAGLFGFVVAIGVGIVLGSLSSSLHPGLTIPTGLLVFAVLAALTTNLLIVDDSCVGLLRGNLQFRRNAVFAASKLAVLPILIVVWRTPSGIELEVAWVVGMAISLITVGIALAKLTKGESSRLDFRHLLSKRRLIAGHHSLNLSIQSPRLIIPVVVAITLGARVNAAYTAATLVLAFVNIIPFHLSTVLFALTPGDEVGLHREVRKTMRICLLLALASAPFYAIFSHLILGFFGPSYEKASTALAILGLTTYPIAIKAHYVAISRARGRMQQAARRSMIGAGLEIGLAAAGGIVFGITGVAIGYLAAVVLEGLLFAPVVFGVLRNPKGGDDAPPGPSSEESLVEAPDLDPEAIEDMQATEERFWV
jgi:O-antigen/teichoic acid export membrane protein